MAIIILALGTGIVWIYKTDRAENNADISASSSPTPVSTSSPEATTTVRPVKRSPTPTPGIIVTEAPTYKDWVKLLDPQNRRLALDKDCTSIVPSQVDYPNNTEIMLDNTVSATSRILKIGDHEYALGAHSWILTTLHSDTLPARLTMFCGNMELGQLDLVAR